MFVNEIWFVCIVVWSREMLMSVRRQHRCCGSGAQMFGGCDDQALAAQVAPTGAPAGARPRWVFVNKPMMPVWFPGSNSSRWRPCSHTGPPPLRGGACEMLHSLLGFPRTSCQACSLIPASLATLLGWKGWLGNEAAGAAVKRGNLDFGEGGDWEWRIQTGLSSLSLQAGCPTAASSWFAYSGGFPVLQRIF